MRRIVIVYFDAGGGHRAAARALAESIGRQGRPWQVIALNLDDVLEPADPIHRATGVRGAISTVSRIIGPVTSETARQMASSNSSITRR